MPAAASILPLFIIFTSSRQYFCTLTCLCSYEPTYRHLDDAFIFE
jgi:hypothetical protein